MPRVHFATLLRSSLALSACLVMVGCPLIILPDEGLVLIVSRETLDFGTAQTTLTFQTRIAVTARNPVPFTVTTNQPWLRVNPATAFSSGPSDSVTITATVDRSALTVGDNLGEIRVAATGAVPRTIAVSARALVVANFTANRTAVFTDDLITFADQSAVTPDAAPITSWLWNFGDGTTSADQNPAPRGYRASGVYTVSLTVTSASGTDTETKTRLITVSTKVLPTADFIASNLNPIANSSVLFTDRSAAGTAPVTGWLWEFGNGQTSTLQNPSHAYAAAGTYTVSLTAFTAHGSHRATKPAYITVHAIVNADFAGLPTSGIAPVLVNFTNLSSGEFNTLSWDFTNDGTADSSAANPSFTYTTGGTYSVSLTAAGPGGTDIETKTNYITVYRPVAANFTATPTSGRTPLVVTFTNTSTGDFDTFRWDFNGDGTPDSALRTPPPHVYTTVGTFTVSLTVSGLGGTNTKTVTGLITVLPTPPTANFSVSTLNPFAGDPVQFTDQSVPGTSPITARRWDFGDGGASTLANPTYTFFNPGNYTVSLTVTTAVGSNTASRIVNVRPKVAPTANFTAMPANPKINQNVTFTDTSQPGSAAITSWAWTFGDGGTSAVQNPTRAYANPGFYTVTLTVTSAHGTHSVTKSDIVTVEPIVDFVADRTAINVGSRVNFTDRSQTGNVAISTWAWNFGNGLTSNLQNPGHTYGTAGSFTVSLGITLANNMKATSFYTTKPDYITATVAGPRADFTVSDETPVMFQIVNFYDRSDPGSAPITRWEWDFGDPPTSNAQNPFHIYNTPGTYLVSLTVTTPFGTDTATKTIIVGGPQPTAQFKQDKKVVLRGIDEVTFTSTSYVAGEGYIHSLQWRVWQGDPTVLPPLDDIRAGGTAYRTQPKTSLRQYPWHEAGLYHVALTVLATTMTDPGNPDDPANLVYFMGDTIIKANAIEVREPSSLDYFINTPPNLASTPDPNYGRSLVNTITAADYKAFVLTVNSHKWESAVPSIAGQQQWKHWLTIVQPKVPAEQVKQVALLYLEGGTSTDAAPTAVDPDLAQFAVDSGSVVAILHNVPNQPLTFPGAGAARSEDRLIAGSLDSFMTTGDPRTIALYPMVKSAVRGMDTVQRFLANPVESGNFPPVIINDFVVAGGSTVGLSRGWAAWLTAAHDPRVVGLIPIGFEYVNIWNQLPYQFYSLGRYTEAIADYTASPPAGFDLDSKLTDPRNMYWPLQIKEDWRRLERVHRLVLEDVRDDFFRVPNTGNNFDHLDDMRDLLDLKEDPPVSPYEIIDHLRSLPSSPARNNALAAAQALWDKLDAYLTTPPDTPAGTRAAVAEIAGGQSNLYGGDAGGVGNLLRALEQELLQARRGAWVQFLTDPIYYNDPYNHLMDFYSEYGPRLRQPKYIIGAPGDRFSVADAAHQYFGFLDGDKFLRNYPGLDHELLGTVAGVDQTGYPQVVFDALPWYLTVLARDPFPNFRWTFLSDEQLLINAPEASQLILWTAKSGNGDFRASLNPAPPSWVATPMTSPFIQIFPEILDYTAYFVEALFETPTGPITLSTEVKIVPPYRPPFKSDQK